EEGGGEREGDEGERAAQASEAEDEEPGHEGERGDGEDGVPDALPGLEDGDQLVDLGGERLKGEERGLAAGRAGEEEEQRGDQRAGEDGGVSPEAGAARGEVVDGGGQE